MDGGSTGLSTPCTAQAARFKEFTMPKYRFHIDRPLPDDEQIQRYEDFGKLLEQVPAAGTPGSPEPPAPGRSSPWIKVAGVGAALGVVMLASWLWVSWPQQQASTDTNTKDFTGLQLPFLAFSPQDTLFPATAPTSPMADAFFTPETPLPPDFPAPLPSWDRALAITRTEQFSWKAMQPEGNLTLYRWENGWKEVKPSCAPERAAPAGPRPTPPEVIPPSQPPVAPRRAFGVKLTQPEQYPEFRGLTEVYWEYLPGTNSADPWQNQLTGESQGWEEISAQSLSKGAYALTFSKMTSQGTIIRKRVVARPLFQATSQAEAEQMVAAKNAAYQQALAEWKAAEAEREALAEKQARAYRDALRQWENSAASGGGVWTFPVNGPGYYLMVSSK